MVVARRDENGPFLVAILYRDGRWIKCWPGFDQAKGPTLPYDSFIIWYLKYLPKYILNYYTQGEHVLSTFPPPDKKGKRWRKSARIEMIVSFLWPIQLWRDFDVLLFSFFAPKLKLTHNLIKIYVCLFAQTSTEGHISANYLILKKPQVQFKAFSNLILLNFVFVQGEGSLYLPFTQSQSWRKP